MDEKLNDIWEKIKSFFGAMSKTTKIMLVVLFAAILIIFLARWFVISNKPYEVVFYDLTNADMTAVSAYLVESGMQEGDFKISGNDLLVPDGEADQIRAACYARGIPNSGSAYETYSAMVGAMSTDSDKETAARYDLEARLGATIRSFDGVHDATVTIAQGEDRRYVLDSSNLTETTASVFLTLSGGSALSTDITTAIRLAVSHAVSDLDIASVSIVDNWGNTYTDSSSGTSAISEASYLKLGLEEYINNTTRTQIMLLLSPVYGEDDINVSVNSTVNVDRKIFTATDYQEPEYGLTSNEDPRGIIGSEMWNGYAYGSDGAYIGGIVGANPNSDVPMYPADADGDGLLDYYGGSNGQIDYKVPQTDTQGEQLAGVVEDVQIGITLNSNNQAVADTDLETLASLVGTTAKIGTELVDDKITIMLLPFIEKEEELEEGGLETWVWFAIIAGLALFLIIVIIIVILVRKKKREEEEALLAAQEEEDRRIEAEQAAAEIAAMAPVDGADIMDVNTEKSMELRKDLRTFVGNNPEIAAALLRNLMKGGEPPPDAT